MSFLIAHDVGKEICEKLGIPFDLVRSITIKIEPDEGVVIEIIKYVTQEELNEIVTILKKYKLEEI